ncbi:cellulose binding domain-containing protein [Micromonospora sp. DT229]|uniref:cellulose binding domain-containing protein n=1 Tax=Micromonospora sp. DT229 TaxID=3393430 RepID=UPI003CF10A24
MLRRPLRNAAAGFAAVLLAITAWSAPSTPLADPVQSASPVAASVPLASVPLADPVRIMPLGDSITGSPGCWRALLWNRLQSAGHSAIDFVGTLGPQGCGQPYDGDNEGHGGYLATNVANQNLLPGWLSATRPDIVLMHFGTNDVWSNIAPTTILTAYSRLVDQMRASNPAMRILVAKIIPMAPSSCPECGQRTVALNNAIDGWAAGRTTSQSPIVVVDQWTGFNTATDTYDGVHPNAAGDQKMSDRWYPALVSALTGIPTPTPTPTPTVTPTPTATATPTPPPGGCVASYRLAGSWQGGFQAEVTVRNDGASALTGWVVRLDFADGQRVTQAWSAEVTQTGSVVTARNAGWNGTLSPGAQTTFGFLASAGSTNTAPTAHCSRS